MNKRERNKRNSFVPTKCVSVRGDLPFWEMCEKQAKIEQCTRNNFIISVITNYCKDKENGK